VVSIGAADLAYHTGTWPARDLGPDDPLSGNQNHAGERAAGGADRTDSGHQAAACSAGAERAAGGADLADSGRQAAA